MGTLGSRHGLALAALAATSALLLASCSSGTDDETAASASASAILPSATASESVPSSSATAAPSGAAALACAAYFDLDLLNSSYAGGAVKNGNLTEAQVREEFQTQLKELTAQAKLAVSDGTADEKLAVNAKRMKKTVNSLKKEQALKELTTKQQARFAKSSLRVQKACTRAGFPLPADNITARTAAGL